MLKFLLIVALIVYILYKIGSFFFRAGAASRQFHNPRNPNFNTNGTSTPNNKKGKGSGFKGGEYVDYEEVK